jgi:chromosome segregation ATPase
VTATETAPDADEVERLRAALAVATRSLEAATSRERLTTCDELARLSREVATLRAAYATDLDGLRAEVRRADDDREARRAEAARLTAERDAAHAAIAGLREEIADAADTLHRLSLAQQRRASAGSEDARARGDAYERAAQIAASVGDPAAVRMEPMTASALDAACAAEDRATVDEPLLDGTDGAHPAWWRGHDRAAEVWRERVATAERARDEARAAAAGVLTALEAPAPVWDADESEHDAHAARMTLALDAVRALLAGCAL